MPPGGPRRWRSRSPRHEYPHRYEPPPAWCDAIARHGWRAVHWSEVGDPRATDRAVMDYAKANRLIVFAHDLDFGALLAATRAEGPSVLQIRTQDVLPDHLEGLVIGALRQYEDASGPAP